MGVQPDVRSQLRTLSIPREQRPASGSQPGPAWRAVRWMGGLAVVGLVGFGAYAGWAMIAAPRGDTAPISEIRFLTVSKSSNVQPPAVLTATGKIVSDHTVEVATKVSGQIIELSFEQGDHVEKDQILARLEDVNYRARRDEAAAVLTRVQANLAFQKVNYARVASLHQGKIAPPIELADARRGLDEASATVAAARAALDFAQKALDDTVVQAPIAGVILTRNVEVGDFVAAEGGLGANANSRFAVIADMTKLRVEVDISELDIARIHRDMSCVITPDAYKDRRYDGHVMWLDPGANYSKATVQVKVRVENPDDYLRVEGSSQVVFLEDQPPVDRSVDDRSSIWIPASACVLDPSDPSARVFVWTQGRLREARVTIGRRHGDQVEVTSGLTAGQTIAAERLNELRDGQTIQR